MVLNLRFSKDTIFLLNLYEINEGTLKKICQVGNINPADGRIYRIKRDLINLNIISLTGKVKEEKIKKRTRYSHIYKIKHSAIDQIFFGELKIKILYDRIKQGKVSVFMNEIKPKQLIKNEK